MLWLHPGLSPSGDEMVQALLKKMNASQSSLDILAQFGLDKLSRSIKGIIARIIIIASTPALIFPEAFFKNSWNEG